MTIEEANYSLKLECALRDLGFLEIRERVLANAGIYYVRPIGFSCDAKLWEDLFGFQVEKSEEWEYHKTTGLCLGKPVVQSAKMALDLALHLS